MENLPEIVVNHMWFSNDSDTGAQNAAFSVVILKTKYLQQLVSNFGAFTKIASWALTPPLIFEIFPLCLTRVKGTN